MAITSQHPTAELLNSVFEDFLRPTANPGGQTAGLLRAPSADVVETHDQIRVLVELPGMRAEDIDLDLEQNVLTIAGEKRQERQGENEVWHLSERRYGRFSRSFVLPRDLEQEQIRAHFENGVLTVTIPKSERVRRRRIQVQNGGGQQAVESGTGGTR